jgi:hypothetical protein
MKRSIIAVAALLLLLSSTTYAAPPRSQRRARFFWGPVLAWFSFVHHHGPGRMARHDEHGQLPPGHRGRPYYGRGWHFGWDNGRHYGWDQNHEHREGKGGGQDGHGRG